MANQNDRFIDEVTDELRRDRLFRAMRRYGWIAIALIVAGGLCSAGRGKIDRDQTGLTGSINHFETMLEGSQSSREQVQPLSGVVSPFINLLYLSLKRATQALG